MTARENQRISMRMDLEVLSSFHLIIDSERQTARENHGENQHVRDQRARDKDNDRDNDNDRQ